ncbi:MAG: hypothetical protein ACRDPN_01065, partial [Aeromicrobium sp.]
MTATYTVDVFSSLDGFGAASGNWTGYWGKQGPELLDHRHALYGEEQRMVFGANTYRAFARMPASSTEESEVRDPWVTRMISLPAMGCAAVSADGYIADDDGQIGSLFDWMAGGDVEWKWSESDEYAMRSTHASKDFMQSVYT